MLEITTGRLAERVASPRIRLFDPAVQDIPPQPERPEGQTVGIVARLHPIKGHATLLRAFEIVRRRCPLAHLLIVGTGAEGDRIARLARALGIAAAVEFAGFEPDIASVYARIDVLAHPVREEAFGRVVIEAMRAGRPVVATPKGIAAEVIRHGHTGNLVPVDDVETLANALVALLRSPNLRSTLATGASRATAGRFTVARPAAAHRRGSAAVA